MRALLSVLLLVLVLAGVGRAGDPPLPGAPNDRAADAYERGERLLRAGKLLEAAEAFDAAAKAAPMFHVAHFAAGNALAQAGRLREAEKRYRECVAVAPRYAPGWNALGVVHLAQDRPKDAVKALDRALSEDPEHLLARLHRGEALVRAGRPRDGEKDARAVLAKEPGNGDARVVLASAAAARGDVAAAQKELDVLLEEQPSHGAGWLLRAVLCGREGRLGAAAQAVARAVERAGDRPSVRAQGTRIASQIAATAARGGETAAAVRALRVLVVLVPKSAAAHARLGAALITHWETRPEDARDPRELEAARRALERSLELDPDQPHVRRLLKMYEGGRESGNAGEND